MELKTQNSKLKTKKGFTLIELLIVIGIISILATAVVLVLNPAQLLAQARDATRISDLGSLKSAIGLYLATATSPTVGETARGTISLTCWFGASCAGACAEINATTTVAGGGWVGIDLTGTTGGSSLSALPLDPSQTATYQYTYDGNNTDKTFELNANLESTKYSGLEATDGGTCATAYEVGSEPGLDL